MKRPAGITALALLNLCAGTALAVHAAVLYSHPAIRTNSTNAYLRQLFPSDPSQSAQILYGAAVGGFLLLAVAGGLWFLQELARWTMLLAAGLPLGRGVGMAAVTFATDRYHFDKLFGTAFWIEMVACGITIFYLTQPDVRDAFGRSHRFVDAYKASEQD